jgi:signal transduction histidine kinase
MTIAETSRGPLDDRLLVVLHEIRQPVSVVLALAEAARETAGVTPEVRDYLDRIIDQAQELAGVTRSIAEPRAGGDPQRRRVADADEVVTSVLDAFALTWTGSLARSGWRGELPVAGDRSLLRRCLVNVLDNAVRAAGPTGRVVVTTRRTPTTVEFLVEDDGPGFGKVPAHTGLGLEVTRQVLADMGGELVVGLPARKGGGSVALVLRAAAPELQRAARQMRAV